MKTKSSELIFGGISSDAVKAKTGKDWAGWLRTLDKDKAHQLTHTQIAQLLHDKHEVPGWWCQMVAVGYEQARGLRVKNQKCDGDFSVDVSKVIGVPLATLYRAVADARQRVKWLKAKLTVRLANENKNLRANLGDKTANLSMMFYAKGENKSQIVITESKLDGAEHVEQRRAFWKGAVAKLVERLE